MNLNPSNFKFREGNVWLHFIHIKVTEFFENFTKAAEHVKSDPIRNGDRNDRQCACLCCASRDQTLGIQGIPLTGRIDRYLEWCSKRQLSMIACGQRNGRDFGLFLYRLA